MKSSTVALLALSAAAERAAAQTTYDYSTPSPSASAMPLNLSGPGPMCTSAQQSGLDFSDHPTGDITAYGGAFFQGFKVAAAVNTPLLGLKANFAVTARTAGATTQLSAGLDNAPTISSLTGSGIKSLDISTDQSTQLELHFVMPNQSTCVSTATADASGTTVENDACPGATSVKLVAPQSSSGCGATVSKVQFQCPTQSSGTTDDASPASDDDEGDDEDCDDDEPEPTGKLTPINPVRVPGSLPQESSVTFGSAEPTATPFVPSAGTQLFFAETTQPAMETITTVTPSTSFVFTTSTRTVTSCAPEITNCPVRQGGGPVVVTDTIIVSTTICPVTATITRPKPNPAASTSAPVITSAPAPAPTSAPAEGDSPAGDNTSNPDVFVTTFPSTSTVWTTKVRTITSCAPEITNCPVREGGGPVVVTETVIDSTTICPVTATMTRGAPPPDSTPATPDNGSGDSPGDSPVQNPPPVIFSNSPTTMIPAPTGVSPQPTFNLPPVPTGMVLSGAGRLGASASLLLGVLAAVALL